MKDSGYFLKLLKLDTDRYPVIAVVGGGGKTSLIYRLSEELHDLGKKVIISTTTHMAQDPTLPFAEADQREAVESLLEKYRFAVAAKVEKETGKWCSPGEEALKKLTGLCDVMLIEADGAKRKPLKVPADWEPVDSFLCRCGGKCDWAGLSWKTHLRDSSPGRVYQLLS